MPTYTGGCHCGRIAYQVEGEIEQVLDCNCSMCAKRGGLLWFVPRSAMTLKSKEGDYGTYRFNKHVIDHHFCLDCGISAFSEPKMSDNNPMVCINARCLDDVDLSTVKIVPYDGRSR